MKTLNLIITFLILFFLAELRAEIYRYATLEWTPQQGMTLYETEVKNINSGQTKYFRSQESTIEIKLEIGKYSVRMRSYDKRGVPGSWGSEKDLIIVPPEVKVQSPTKISKVSSLDNESIELKWEPLDSAQYYWLEIKSEVDGDVQKLKVMEPIYKINLPNRNKYKWTVKGVINGIEGESPEASQDIELIGDALSKPDLDIPKDGFVENILWDPVVRSENYEFELFRFENNQWKKYPFSTSKTDQIYITIPSNVPAGKYKISIRSTAKYSLPSIWHEEVFTLREGSRSVNAFRSFLMKAALEMSTNKYFVASYLITYIDYQSRYLFTDVKFKAWGGTGRLGMGYIRPKDSFGIYGIADMSGFIINKKNHTFKSIEFHGFYRKKLELSQYRISAGLFLRDMPEIASTSEENQSQFESVSVAGPQIGFEYWKVISKKLGFQINSRFYQSLFKISTPQNAENVPVSSYQFGLLGSYRLTPQILGLAGYAYRVDQVSYKTISGIYDHTAKLTSVGDEINKISIRGHYLNLVLEIGF